MGIIDIIIPTYNAQKTLERTLFSISYQTISDQLNVYIVNDKSDDDYTDIINFFSMFLNIKEIKLEKNVGPGLAREEGIKNSNSKYIMFIDSDDMFASPKSIEIIYKEIEKNDLDVVIGKFVECRENDFIHHDNDEIWLHGKIYRREFIEQNNIHFNSSRANEDNYFNQCVMLSDPRKKYIDYPIYFWMYNENSITRKNDFEYSYKGLFGYISNMNEALLFAVKNNKNKVNIGNFSLAVLCAIYYYYIEYNDQEFLKCSKSIKRIYLDHREYINNEENIKKTQYDFAISNLTPENINGSTLTFDEFLESIGD